MITALNEEFNGFSQESYDSVVNNLQLHTVKCTCGKKGCLIRYGHYHRHVKYLSELLKLRIQRVLCTQCGKTHALMLSSLVPYSQVAKEDQQEILDCVEKGTSPQDVMLRNFLIDENTVKYIIRQFRKHWKQRILSLGLTLSDALTVPCLHTFGRQFMQVHKTCNILYSSTNTA